MPLMTRATPVSYTHLFSPVDFELKPGETIKIPTGIRVFIESDWVLNIFPRSGLGFKFRLQMNNTDVYKRQAVKPVKKVTVKKQTAKVKAGKKKLTVTWKKDKNVSG